MTGSIYKIVNDINDKVYVGQTIQSLKKRFTRHCSDAEWAENNMAIKKAILKYGKEHFRIELIEDCDAKLLDEREIYWIDFYDSYRKGYNLTRGGRFNGYGGKLTVEEEQKLVELYQQGLGSLKIAKIFNIDKTTVLNYAKRNGLKRKDTLDGIVDIEAVKAYIRENKPLVKDVTEKFGISRGSVYNIIKRSNDETLVLKSYNPRKSGAVIHAQEICDKYNEGYNIQDLVRMFHSPKRYISKVLKSNGVEIQRGRKARIEYNNSKSVQTLSLL